MLRPSASATVGSVRATDIYEEYRSIEIIWFATRKMFMSISDTLQDST